MGPIDRRRFLAATAGLVAAGAAGTVVGCGSSSGKAALSGSSKSPPFAIFANSFDFFAGIDQRVAVALETNNGDPIHPSQPVSLQIGPIDGPLGPPQPTVIHSDGLANPYLLMHYRFQAPGTYTIRALYKGKQADLLISVILPSSTPIPVAGKPLPSVPTPTLAAPMGVNPVCTAQPPCPFHEVSLDAALAQHRRIALMFATPALCQSRLCGPSLDNLISVHQPYANQVTFIHCEIFTDLSGQTSTPPVTAYHLEHEPLLLLAGTDGVVRERIDNAFDRGEATDALRRLVSA